MLNNPFEGDICLVYNMTIPPASGNHATGFIDGSAESVDSMMPFLLWQDFLLEPVVEITGYHLYEQIQLITFIINLAVFTKSKAGLDFINRCFNGAPLIIVVKNLSC